ncbi:unnamed protein product [Didymodactylos carnosus]|uniref:Lantibiotic biosynthesis protein dehydration domain-containing protein n=1 Tax=Didymodactylos carnosus TaxID=1234261 RepID=A0A814QIK2_9BILA|nr:unnamed protein product [Didymodactylos carnosus]CAF1327094.1 unnamed protein product [Didymodactylos carnosus]CAF3883830.1 unnamed protein product [Didymodactylos carnosus]CAF4138447.1 unnamed protein product [Didymodactylos carnosus]
MTSMGREFLLSRIQYRDIYRSQYYLPLLETVIRDMVLYLENVGCINIDHVLFDLIQTIANELDDMILPTVVYEIHSHKGRLSGETAMDRYKNFFFDHSAQTWASTSRTIVKKHKFLFDMMNGYCHSTIDNVKYCLNCLKNDKTDIYQKLLICAEINELCKVTLSGSDRHRNGQTVLFLSFNNQQKLVYKNSNSSIDKTFELFINKLNLLPPYDIKIRNYLTKDGYTWYEYLKHESCQTEQELKHYYIRSGSLLAIVDLLNFTDGHCQNLLAYGQYPILLDLETLYHNFQCNGSQSNDERSIIYTGLIDRQEDYEKNDRNESRSAFQTTGLMVETFQPLVFNDHTDEIKLFFVNTKNSPLSIDQCTSGPRYMLLQNSPCFNGQTYTIHSYLNDFIHGYKYTYSHIEQRKDQLLDNSNQFWFELNQLLSTRQIMRSTLFYSMLIRHLQQPHLALSKAMAQDYLFKYLSKHSSNVNPNILEYEINELLKLNIPYFTQQPNSQQLFDGNGQMFEKFFISSSIEQIRSNIQNMNERYCLRQIEILCDASKQTMTKSGSKCYVCLTAATEY